MKLMFDFDSVIERRGGDSSKWSQSMEQDFLPMPVADMDFKASPAVLEAIHRRADHGVFGYAKPPDSLIETICWKLQKDYQWEIDPSWLVWLPGLVTGLNIVCRMQEPETQVVTSTPIYPPFLSAPMFANRPLVKVPMEVDNQRYVFPFDRMEEVFTRQEAGLWMNCNPHNPSGRVCERSELEKIAQLCLSREVVICSDEIHAGLVLDADRKHIPIATLSPEVEQQTITLMSPSKTYNLAGLMWSYAIIPNVSLRRRFLHTARGLVTELNVFGYAACEAAYRQSDSWHQALLDVLRRNRDLVERRVGGLPGVWMPHVEATYLAWLDCQDLPVTHSELMKRLEHAGLGLSDGRHFDAPGFVRLNFACPMPTLEEGLNRLETALSGL